MLRVLRQLLVLLEQLRGVAARAAVDPVHLVAATAALLAVAAAAATIVTIVVQGNSLPSSGRPACPVAGKAARMTPCRARHRTRCPICLSVRAEARRMCKCRS